MFKNKLNYKLINFAVFCFVVLMIYLTSDAWTSFFGTVFKIIEPFFFGFALAYALYPTLQWLEKHKWPKVLAITLITIIVIGVVALLVGVAAPLLFNQLGSMFGNIITSLRELSSKYSLNLGSLQTTLSNSFNSIINSLSQYVSNGAVNIINISIGVLTKIFIAFATMVYFLSDMPKIRTTFKKFLLHHNKRAFEFFKLLDHEMRQYLIGFIKIVFISLVEYTVVYSIIGHPNALLLGLLAAISVLIPYFGGIIVNIIAIITSFAVSTSLLIRTIIVVLIFSNVDGYVISPLVYGKTNKINPLLTILGVFAGGILFGVFGIVFSLPIMITIVTAWNFYEDDIIDKVSEIKNK